MTQKYINNTNISLSMAVYLANDQYDHDPDPNKISVTTLIRPIKQIILASRVDKEANPEDIESVIQSQNGTAIHTAVETAWMTNHKECMTSLGYSDSMISRVKINPTKKDLEEYDLNLPAIPVYLEQRSSKKVSSKTVTGKFDLVMDGVLEDVKNTTVYTYIFKSKDKDYQLQGSIYKWLNPDKITKNYMLIQYVFSDWNATAFAKNPRSYPPKRLLAYKVPLLPVEETEAYVKAKVQKLEELWNYPEELLPRCTNKELWRKDSVWKYYKNPNKRIKSTANFKNEFEAYQRLHADGDVGVVIEVPSEVKACPYCPAKSICQQRKEYFSD